MHRLRLFLGIQMPVQVELKSKYSGQKLISNFYLKFSSWRLFLRFPGGFYDDTGLQIEIFPSREGYLDKEYLHKHFIYNEQKPLRKIFDFFPGCS